MEQPFDLYRGGGWGEGGGEEILKNVYKSICCGNSFELPLVRTHLNCLDLWELIRLVEAI